MFYYLLEYSWFTVLCFRRAAKWFSCTYSHGFNPWARKIPWGGGMATHSSILAWRIPWTEEHGGLQAMGSQSQTWLSDLACIHISILFWIIFPHRLLQNIEPSSLNYTVGPYWLSVLYIVVCIWQFQAPSLSNFFPLVSISLFSRSMSLFLFCK